MAAASCSINLTQTAAGITVNQNSSTDFGLTSSLLTLAALQLDNSAGTNLSDRIGDNIGLTLSGGTFNYLGNNAPDVASTETMSTFTLSGGNSIISIQSGAGAGSTVAVTSAGLLRSVGAAATFQSGTSATDQDQGLGTLADEIFFANGASILNNGILPWATIAGAPVDNTDVNFATYGATGIAPYTNYVTSLAAAGPTSNVKLTNVSETLSSNKTINSLIISGSFTETLSTATLTIASGGLVATGGSVGNNNLGPPASVNPGSFLITGGTLEFGTNEGIITANTNLAIASVIDGSAANSLTLAAGVNGYLTLTANNTYSGTTTLVGPGNIAYSSNSPFGNNTINFNSGTLTSLGQAITGGTLALANPINFSNRRCHRQQPGEAVLR